MPFIADEDLLTSFWFVVHAHHPLVWQIARFER
jgi:hypothetical protein